jgi:hypothetical protein
MASLMPANWVANNYEMPAVCARHGQPAARAVRITLINKPSRWAYFGLVGLLTTWAVQVKVKAPSWPFCAACVARHTRFQIIGSAGLAVAVVIGAVGLLPAAGLSWLVPVGIIVAMIGAAFLGNGGWRSLSGAFVEDEGQTIEVPEPHPAFAAQARAMMAAADATRPTAKDPLAAVRNTARDW